MNVLVSDTTTSYDNWLVVRTLRDVQGIVGNIDNLVYHKSSESSDDKIKYLTEINKKMVSCKIIYICNKEDADNAIRMLVVGGLRGKYISDEFYLESDRELNTLITDLSIVSSKSELSSSAVLMDFFNRYMSDGSKGISKGYLQVVKNAAIEMTESYRSKSIELLKMSESAAEIFSNSVELVSQMKEQQSRLERDLRVLKDSKNELDAFNMKPVMGSSIMFYPRVSYLKNKTIIRIKDLGNCKFLISFVLGFREYLEKIKSVRPKLVVVEGNGICLEEIYKNYDWVTTKNKNDSRNFYGNVTFTNCPTTVIMNRLLDDSSFDTFIVLDRTVNYKDHILNSKGICVTAVSGASIIDKFKLHKNRCICSINDIDGTMLTIPYFNDYPSRDDQRVNKYLKECSTFYELIYNNRDK